MAYTFGQLQTLLRDAGFPEKIIPTMAAIGLAESAGKPDAINPGVGKGGRKTNEYSVGLFQINTLVHKNYSVDQLKNPNINVKEALRIYKSQGLRAWGAYTDGRYKKYLSSAGYEAVPSGDDDSTSAIGAGIGGILLIGLLVWIILDD